jgi:hypothetical protein
MKQHLESSRAQIIAARNGTERRSVVLSRD